MRLIHVLLLAFIAVPVVEIWLILQVGAAIGAWATVAVIIATAVLGTVLLRREGLSTLFRLQREVDQGQLPARTLVEGALLLFAGALLLTPGFATDAVGFACLLPPLRGWMAARILAAGVQGIASGRVRTTAGGDASGAGGFRRRRPRPAGDTIEGEYRRLDDD